MNEKHAREARITNRLYGRLSKRGEGPQPHKLPRAVKRAWASKSHKRRGWLSRIWRGEYARSLVARGVELNGNRKERRAAARDVIDRRQWFRSQSRSMRKRIIKMLHVNDVAFIAEDF